MGRFPFTPNSFDDGGRDAVSLGIDTSRSHRLDGANILTVVAPPHRLPLRVLLDGLPSLGGLLSYYGDGSARLLRAKVE